jgi:hypothetical protein
MYWKEGVDSTSEGLWIEVSRLDVLIPIVQPGLAVVKKIIPNTRYDWATEETPVIDSEPNVTFYYLFSRLPKALFATDV